MSTNRNPIRVENETTTNIPLLIFTRVGPKLKDDTILLRLCLVNYYSIFQLPNFEGTVLIIFRTEGEKHISK